MIMLLLILLLAVGAAILVFKKVSNLPLRYFLMFVFLSIAAGIFWIFWIALRSGEM